MEINEKYIIEKAADKTAEQLWWALQDLYVDCLKNNKDKEEIIKAVLNEILSHKVWNILSMLKK
jgi:hypothetical protein